MEELERLLKIEERTSKRGMEIQKNYIFEITDYVLHEIVKKEEDKDDSSIISLINLATINNKISPEDARILKRDVKSRKVYSNI